MSTLVQSKPADAGRSSASPYKMQVSEMVKSMVEQKQFLPLSFTVRKTKYRMEKDARQYKLPSGPSRVALFKLPEYAWEYILRIRSLKYGVEYIFHTFSPSGVFLIQRFGRYTSCRKRTFCCHLHVRPAL